MLPTKQEPFYASKQFSTFLGAVRGFEGGDGDGGVGETCSQLGVRGDGEGLAPRPGLGSGDGV